MKKTFLAVAVLIIALTGILYFTDMGKNLTASVLENAPTFVTLHTNRGDVKIQLLATDAPKLSENFWRLAKDGKYDRTIFHRVIRGFMIQGGDFENSNGTGGTSYWGELLADEISPNLSHVRGAVSMANRGPDTNGSQFFIVHEDATFLDGRHSVFGNVIEGMDVVDKISDSKTDMNDFPLEPILITSVSFE